MIKASHPKSGFFTEYIYTIDEARKGNKLDVFLKGNCTDPSPEGYYCDGCYERKLYELLGRNNNFIGLKKVLTYQLGLYEDPNNWLKQFKMWMKHSNLFRNDNFVYLIDDVLDDIEYVEAPQADLSSFISITNNFNDSTIHQVNMGGTNSLSVSYDSVLDEMETNGIPTDIVSEGRELLKDADKSDSLKKIAGNWIKGLPFKVMEKAGDWAIKHPEVLAKYQDDLMNWISSI